MNRTADKRARAEAERIAAANAAGNEGGPRMHLLLLLQSPRLLLFLWPAR
jgi:hypothetical protein